MDPSMQQKLFQLYQKEGEEIIRQMYAVLIRAQRKIDDKAYCEALKKMS